MFAHTCAVIFHISAILLLTSNVFLVVNIIWECLEIYLDLWL